MTMDQCKATTKVGGKYHRCEREPGNPECAKGNHIALFSGAFHRWHELPAKTAVVTLPAPVPVYIVWAMAYGCDWHWYDILGFAGEWVRLQGRSDDDNNPYRGGPIWEHVSRIDSMQEVER